MKRKTQSELAWRALDFMNSHPAYSQYGLVGPVQGCLYVYAFRKDGKDGIASIPSDIGEVVYGFDICFCVFEGNIKSRRDWMHYQKWSRYQGIRNKGKTFDETVIEAAKMTAEKFGAFNDNDSFLTDEEKENHRKETPFFLVPIKGKKIPKNSRTMVDNPKHMRIEPGEINRRWLRWFIQTDGYRKDEWSKDIHAGFRKLVESRKMPDLEPKKVNLEFICDNSGDSK
jgi:hypothetical protein